MARRSSPDRIYAARRAAVLSRLTQERRLSAQRAEALVAAWEVEGDSRGLERMTAAFWEAGTTWMLEQLGDLRGRGPTYDALTPPLPDRCDG